MPIAQDFSSYDCMRQRVSDILNKLKTIKKLLKIYEKKEGRKPINGIHEYCFASDGESLGTGLGGKNILNTEDTNANDIQHDYRFEKLIFHLLNIALH